MITIVLDLDFLFLLSHQNIFQTDYLILIIILFRIILLNLTVPINTHYIQLYLFILLVYLPTIFRIQMLLLMMIVHHIDAHLCIYVWFISSIEPFVTDPFLFLILIVFLFIIHLIQLLLIVLIVLLSTFVLHFGHCLLTVLDLMSFLFLIIHILIYLQFFNLYWFIIIITIFIVNNIIINNIVSGIINNYILNIIFDPIIMVILILIF